VNEEKARLPANLRASGRRRLHLPAIELSTHLKTGLEFFSATESARLNPCDPPNFFLTGCENSGSIVQRIGCVESASMRVTSALLDLAQPSHQSEVFLLVSR
jgi:hypothetical protein